MNFKFACFLALFISTGTFALNAANSDSLENRNRSPIRDRLVFNIGGGIMFGTVTNISLLPQIGYKVTDRLIAGVGGNLHYYSNKYYSNSPFLVYGGSAFLRYRITPQLYAQGELQELNYQNVWQPYGLIGGGYIPSGGGMYVSAYYVVMSPSNSLYGNSPYLIRVGFVF